MNIEEIKQFESRILSMSFLEMKDKEVIAELTRLYVALGDFFALMRLPKNIGLSVGERERYSKMKELWKRRDENSRRIK